METIIKKYILFSLIGIAIIVAGCTDILSPDPNNGTASGTAGKIQVLSPVSNDSIGYAGEQIKYSVTGGSGVKFIELYINNNFNSIFFTGSDGSLPKINFKMDPNTIGTKIDYFLIYYDQNGSSARSDVQKAVVISDVRVTPYSPYNFTFTRLGTGNTLNLSWQDSSLGVTSYEIWRRVGFNGTYSKYLTASPKSFNINDDNALVNTLYYYKIRAVNNAGASAFSPEINSMNVGTSSTALLPPTNLAAVQGVGSTVNLSWDDNSSNENYFKIERRNSWNNFSEILRVNKNTTRYTDSSTVYGLEYIYRIKAVSSTDSAWSNVVSVYPK